MTVMGAPVRDAGSSVAAAVTTTACCNGPTDRTTSVDVRPEPATNIGSVVRVSKPVADACTW
jgi:hypothetical protein